MNVDYIIVGQGLAGSILSYQLIQKGKSVLVYNKEQITNSSQVAAGLFNPVTGRRFVKTWQADYIFPFLHKFYSSLEKHLNCRIFNPIPIFRPFQDIEEQNLLISKSTEDSLGPYINEIITLPGTESLFKNNFGGVFLKQTGYLNIPQLILSSKEFLLEKGMLIEEEFYEEEIKFQTGSVNYRDVSAKKIIFCNGLSASKSKYFEWLPFRPVKGELIHLEMSVKADFVYNRIIFVLPISKNLFRVGATYDWDNINNDPSEEAKNYLESKLKEVLNVNFKTIDQKAGIRPATKDRRPFLGIHPDIKELAIFNGLGSKGVSLAPYYADQFINALEKGTNLDKEVNIERYFSLYV